MYNPCLYRYAQFKMLVPIICCHIFQGSSISSQDFIISTCVKQCHIIVLFYVIRLHIPHSITKALVTSTNQTGGGQVKPEMGKWKPPTISVHKLFRKCSVTKCIQLPTRCHCVGAAIMHEYIINFTRC